MKKQNLLHIDYLEIGSAQGLSMALNGLLLKQLNENIRFVSIDPYFEKGYEEGKECISKNKQLININKTTRENAFKLYRNLNLNVELLEKKSMDGLLDLINAKRKFNYIYIDGFHERFVPMQDLALCLELLGPSGIIMLDDHLNWEDVGFLKFICDKYLIKIGESWKIVVYQKK